MFSYFIILKSFGSGSGFQMNILNIQIFVLPLVTIPTIGVLVQPLSNQPYRLSTDHVSYGHASPDDSGHTIHRIATGVRWCVF